MRRTAALPWISLALAVLAVRSAPAEESPVSAPKAAAPKHVNALASARSPYLRQHAHNPVDWLPWGPEAFAAAKAADKPIFLSIGYAACHWCHVMAHESFEDDATAAVLNDVFVCVKVDREERPDVDDVYMAAVTMTTGHGGWPMTCFLLPDGRPFLARTYLRRGDVVAVAKKLQAMWRDERPRLEGAAEEIAKAVREHAAGPALPPFAGSDADLVRAAVDHASAEFDRARGGFDRVPKFPPHGHLLFFLDRHGTAGGEAGLAMARKTLDAMADGGVHDQVGGGFHRYSTDADWLVPHFEKMLYDNALLAQAYAAASAVTKERRYGEVARDVLAWVVREMSVEGGGYASSLDADTEGHEGVTYVWTPAELEAVLGADDAGFASRVYGVTPAGNYHEEASGRPTGSNILHRVETVEETAKREGRSVAEVEARLDAVRTRLRAARARRPQPGRDGKVITAWNGLLLSAFALAGRDLADAPLLERGRALARFLLEKPWAEGRLLRFPKDSGPAIPGFLDDHVHLAEGLLDLADATGESSWADAARRIMADVLERFRDADGGLFSSSDQHEALLARSKDAYDTPIPSANATAARAWLRLAARTGDPAPRAAADGVLSAFRPLVARAPSGTMAFVRVIADRAALEATGGGAEVADAVVREGVLRVEAFLERREAKPGAAVGVLLRVAVDAGWHVNPAALASGDLVPSALALVTPAQVALEGAVWPVPVTKAPGPGAAPIALLEGRFDVRARLVVPPAAAFGPRKITLRLTCQPCTATECRTPLELEVALPLRFEPADGPALHPALFH